MNINAVANYTNPFTAYTKQNSERNSDLETAVTSKDNNEINKDTVEISSESVLEHFRAKFMNGAGLDGVITLDEIRAAANEDINEAQKILNKIIDELNINSSDKFKIDINSNGKISVSGSSEENNQKLAQALQEDDEFSGLYQDISAKSTLLAACEAQSEFQAAYDKAPKAAIAEYSWLFDKTWDFDMFFQNGKIQTNVS